MSSHLQVAAALAGYYVFSAAAGAMPNPLPGQERSGYGFLFRFVQNLAANAHRLVEARLPGLVAEVAAAEARMSWIPRNGGTVPHPRHCAAEPQQE